jgi:hypothetical protein
LRSRPVLPPSSATVTIAVSASRSGPVGGLMHDGKYSGRKPRSSVDRPLPPPSATMRGRAMASSSAISPGAAPPPAAYSWKASLIIAVVLESGLRAFQPLERGSARFAVW